MAFVPTPAAALRSGSFMGTAITPATPPCFSTLRMVEGQRVTPPDSGTPVFGKSGKSLWKENLFTGGFPGGEMFFRTWLDEGMMRDVPDLPDSLQPKTKYKPKKQKKEGILGKLDATEFFKDFIGIGGGDDNDDEDYSEQRTTKSGTGTTKRAESDVSDGSSYKSYFPSRRNVAPDIRMGSEKSSRKDSASMSMKDVDASSIDVYFPEAINGKAPIIEMFYNGSLKSAYVSVRFDMVEGLPTLPPPPSLGEAVTSLVPGRGGGMRLKFAVEGEGEMNI